MGAALGSRGWEGAQVGNVGPQEEAEDWLAHRGVPSRRLLTH